MKPPAGRVQIGDRVVAPGGRQGRVVEEQLIVSNGAWQYTVALDDGATVRHLDYELKRVAPAA